MYPFLFDRKSGASQPVPESQPPLPVASHITALHFLSFLDDCLPRNNILVEEVQASFYDSPDDVERQRLAVGARTNRDPNDKALLATFTEYHYPDTSIQLPATATHYEVRNKIIEGMKIVKRGERLSYPGHTFRPTLPTKRTPRERFARFMPKAITEPVTYARVSDREARDLLKRLRGLRLVEEAGYHLIRLPRSEDF